MARAATARDRFQRGQCPANHDCRYAQRKLSYIYIHNLKLPKRQNCTIRTAGFAVTHHRGRRIYAPSGSEDMWLVQELWMFPGEDASATRSTFDVSAYLCCDAMGEPSTLLEYNLASDLHRRRNQVPAALLNAEERSLRRWCINVSCGCYLWRMLSGNFCRNARLTGLIIIGNHDEGGLEQPEIKIGDIIGFCYNPTTSRAKAFHNLDPLWLHIQEACRGSGSLKKNTNRVREYKLFARTSCGHVITTSPPHHGKWFAIMGGK